MAKASPIKPRIIFAGTAQFAIPALEKLLKIADIALVLTQPAKPAGRGLKETECPVDMFAQEHHLPIFRPESLKEDVIGKVLAEYPCDYIIVAAYGKILPQWLLNFPKYRCLNIHGSLLPRWRGASPIQHAILSGDKVTGVNLMEMSLGMDEGPILLTAKTPINESSSLAELTSTLGNLGADLLEAFFKNPQIKSIPQEGTATYAPKIQKSMGEIHWNDMTAAAIMRAFQAFDPWPGIYTWTAEKLRVKILDLSVHSIEAQPKHEGSVEAGALQVHNGQLWARAKDSWITLNTIQVEGKNKMSCVEALKDINHWLYKLTALTFRGSEHV